MDTIQITLPSSKSLSNRWLVLDYMSSTGIKVKNASSSDDTQQLGRLLHQLKAGRRHNFDCRDAATVARFMMAILSVTPGTNTLLGSPQLCHRPMKPLIDSLRAAGCIIECTGEEGYLPVKIEGVSPSAPRIVIDCGISSQYASALLLVAAMLPQGGVVELQNAPVSEPYIEMTLKVLSQAKVEWSYKGVPPAYYVEHSMPQCDVISIEKDWSAASYFFEAAALKREVPIRLPGLARESLQGDSILRALYSDFGLTILQGDQSVEICGDKKHADSFQFDFTHNPDLAPAIAVTCAALGMEGRLEGLSGLRFKESNRIESLVTELRKLGCEVEADDHSIHIAAGEPFTAERLGKTGVIDAHGDHRIAMAFGVLKVINPAVEINTPEVVSKSFPDFWKMLERLF